MKKFMMTFLKRGALFAGAGPIILVIVYACLLASGVAETVTVVRMIREILSATALAFIAAGISAIHTVDKMHPAMAGLIQGAVLFADYIGFYLANGWLPFNVFAITLFTVIFVAVFALIWLMIYLSIRRKISRMNEKLS